MLNFEAIVQFKELSKENTKNFHYCLQCRMYSQKKLNDGHRFSTNPLTRRKLFGNKISIVNESKFNVFCSFLKN